MSLPVSPGDVVKGLEVLMWLRSTCFDKNNSADTRYNEFGRDIKGLQTNLTHLQQALEQAHQQYHDPIADVNTLCKESGRLIGDFNTTLAQCKELLSMHVKLEKDRAGFVQNVIWATTIQDRVDDLRQQILFHSQKTYLIIEPLRLGLITNIGKDVSEILEIMKEKYLPQQSLVMETIPAWLQEIFQSNLELNPPKTYTGIKGVPLEEGFDALYRHYHKSTYQFKDPETGDQTVEQYLNLLKSQWMLEIIRKSEAYQQTRRGSLYKRAIAQVEQRISKEYQRGDLVRFGDKELQALNSTSFLIWPRLVGKPKLIVTDAQEGEEEILRLSLSASLSTENEELIFFRTGPTTLRIVRKVEGKSSTSPYHIVERFNTHNDRLIPYYTVAPVNSAPRVELYRANETGGTVFELNSMKDVFAFQRAFTNYQIVSESTHAKWTAKRTLIESIRTGSSKAPVGRAQIWHYKPLTPPRNTGGEITASPSTSNISRDSFYSTLKDSHSSNLSTTIREVIQGSDSSMATVIDGAIAMHAPRPPVLMFYTCLGKDFTYFHLSLKAGFQIVESACECMKAPTICRKTVIEYHKGNKPLPFNIRRMSVEEGSINNWDLSLFGLPHHPNFHDSSLINKIECRYVELKFATPEERQKFGHDLAIALKLRDIAHDAFVRSRITTDHLADKPNQKGHSKTNVEVSQSRSRLGSHSIIRRYSTNPPILEPIETVSVLNFSVT